MQAPAVKISIRFVPNRREGLRSHENDCDLLHPAEETVRCALRPSTGKRPWETELRSMTEGPSLNHEAVMAALEGVHDPELHASITKLGMVKDVSIDGGAVALSIELTTPACPLKDQIGTDIEAALKGIGAKDIEISWGAEVQASTPREGQKPVRGVRNIIAIASNKGGVGKSTVAANLAISLSVEGARVGLLDADITGPNIPTMFGLPAGLQSTSAEGLQGIDRYGVKVISIGFLLPRGTPVVWRGPMVGSAVRQLLHDVTWGELDYLVIDLPPGT